MLFMDTQLTPYHNKLLNSGFFLLQCANALLTFLFYWFVDSVFREGGCVWSASHASVAILGLTAGLCLSGTYVGWLVERFRRNRVCVNATCLFGLCFLLLKLPVDGRTACWIRMLLCPLAGWFFGIAGRVLTCTLVIDKTESFNRTRAGLVTFSVSLLGTFLSVVLFPLLMFVPMVTVVLLICALLLGAVLCIRVLRFPFRTPIETAHPFSLDRFFLPSIWPWFVCLILAAVVVGILASCYQPLNFGKSLLSDVLFPLLGYAIFGLSVLRLLTTNGLHCQRGTILSTCFMAQNVGIPLGYALAQIV